MDSDSEFVFLCVWLVDFSCKQKHTLERFGDSVHIHHNRSVTLVLILSALQCHMHCKSSFQWACFLFWVSDEHVAIIFEYLECPPLTASRSRVLSLSCTVHFTLVKSTMKTTPELCSREKRKNERPIFNRTTKFCSEAPQQASPYIPLDRTYSLP